MELRFVKAGVEVRLAGDGKTLTGYAAVFNKQSTDDGLNFREVCHKGMFARSIPRRRRAVSRRASSFYSDDQVGYSSSARKIHAAYS